MLLLAGFYRSKKMMSVTPDQSKKVGLGMTASPSPFLTPRPERRRKDSRGPEWNSNRQDKDSETNVQVLLRCRSVIAFSFLWIAVLCNLCFLFFAFLLF